MAEIGERRDIENVIKQISRRLICGIHVDKNKEVFFYQINKIATPLAASFTSVGISHPLLSLIANNTNNNASGKMPFELLIESFKGLPIIFLIIGAVTYLSILIARQIYQVADVEKKAVASLALHESFIRLKREFEQKVVLNEPAKQLETVRDAVQILELNNATIFPEQNKYIAEINTYTKEIIKTYHKEWDSAPAVDRKGN